MLNSEITPNNQAELVKLLHDYFNDPLFGNENLDEQTKGLDTAFRCFVERKGACRHRAFAFTLLCQYFEIPTRYISNEVHAFAEVFLEGTWQKVNLGGAPVRIRDLPPQPSLLQNLEPTAITIPTIQVEECPTISNLG